MTMAHIHNAGPTANGGIVVGLVPVGVKATTPLPMLNPTQTGDLYFTGTFTAADFVGALAGKTLADFSTLANANSLCEWGGEAGSCYVHATSCASMQWRH